MTVSANQSAENEAFEKIFRVSALGLALGMAILHGVVVLLDHRLTLVSYILLLGVGVFYAWRNYDKRILMRRVRYGAYRHHIMAFVVVVGSYYLHAGYLILSDQSDLIDVYWKGALYGMGIFWGIGVLVHSFGAFMTKGFEDVQV